MGIRAGDTEAEVRGVGLLTFPIDSLIYSGLQSYVAMQGNLKGSIGRHYFAFFEIFFCVWCVCNLHMNPAPTNSSPMLLPFLPSYHLSNFRVAVRGCPSKSGYLAGRLL